MTISIHICVMCAPSMPYHTHTDDSSLLFWFFFHFVLNNISNYLLIAFSILPRGTAKVPEDVLDVKEKMSGVFFFLDFFICSHENFLQFSLSVWVVCCRFSDLQSTCFWLIISKLVHNWNYCDTQQLIFGPCYRIAFGISLKVRISHNIVGRGVKMLSSDFFVFEQNWLQWHVVSTDTSGSYLQ